MTQTDLKQIGDLIDEKLEQKLEQKLEEKFNEKLANFVTKDYFEKRLEEKFNEKLANFVTKDYLDEKIEWLAAIVQGQFSYIDKNKVNRSELVSWVFN